MVHKVDLTIIIPCFNEVDNVDNIAHRLPPVLERLRIEYSVELLFVDDGSTDGTGDLLAERFRDDSTIRIIRHECNRGLGAGLRTGFLHARGDVVVTADSDATYPFSLIRPLLDRLEPDVDIVTGSCYHPQGRVANVPRYRIFLSRSASLLYRLLVNRTVHTYTCLFRAYRREVVETVPFASDGFLSVTELLVNAILMGYTVRELPCTLQARRYGVSKARVARIIRAHLRYQWQLIRAGGGQPHRAARLLPRPAPASDGSMR